MFRLVAADHSSAAAALLINILIVFSEVVTTCDALSSACQLAFLTDMVAAAGNVARGCTGF